MCASPADLDDDGREVTPEDHAEVSLSADARPVFREAGRGRTVAIAAFRHTGHREFDPAREQHPNYPPYGWRSPRVPEAATLDDLRAWLDESLRWLGDLLNLRGQWGECAEFHAVANDLLRFADYFQADHPRLAQVITHCETFPDDPRGIMRALRQALDILSGRVPPVPSPGPQAVERHEPPAGDSLPQEPVKKPRRRGHPGLTDEERSRRVKEYADYKASGLTQFDYLRQRGSFPGMTEEESKVHLDACRKHWEKANRPPETGPT